MHKVLQFGASLPKPHESPVSVGQKWAESLLRSKAQIAAGETVPLEPALDRLRASIGRMEAKRAGVNKK
jgi:hypothetical protein